MTVDEWVAVAEQVRRLRVAVEGNEGTTVFASVLDLTRDEVLDAIHRASNLGRLSE